MEADSKVQQFVNNLHGAASLLPHQPKVEPDGPPDQPVPHHQPDHHHPAVHGHGGPHPHDCLNGAPA